MEHVPCNNLLYIKSTLKTDFLNSINGWLKICTVEMSTVMYIQKHTPELVYLQNLGLVNTTHWPGLWHWARQSESRVLSSVWRAWGVPGNVAPVWLQPRRPDVPCLWIQFSLVYGFAKEVRISTLLLFFLAVWRCVSRWLFCDKIACL